MKTINTKLFTKISQTQANTAAGIAGAFNQMGAGIKENADAKIQEYVQRISSGKETYDQVTQGLGPDWIAKIDQGLRDQVGELPTNHAVPIKNTGPQPMPAANMPAATPVPAAAAPVPAVPRRKSMPGSAF